MVVVLMIGLRQWFIRRCSFLPRCSRLIGKVRIRPTAAIL
ncbi:hypothetical protein LINPERHAP1_LOCUS8570 [Linum perenne]